MSINKEIKKVTTLTLQKMKESGEKVTPQGKSVSTIFTELLPNQQKSLYFGIRLQP